jgi:small ligand-binding sensory domain FIST
MQITAVAASGGTRQKLVEQLLARGNQTFGGRRPDCGIVFASVHFEDEMQRLAEDIRHGTGALTLLGCTAEAVIGSEHEHEREPAISLWLAHLPDVVVNSFHLGQSQLESLEEPEQWRSALGANGASAGYTIMLGDPYSIDVQSLLSGVNEHLPGQLLIGGMASGAEAPGQAALILDEDAYREGAVGVHLSGDLTIDTVVSQGCRPIGKPFVITRAERNIIHMLGGRKPYDVLRHIFEQSPTRDQELMQQGVLLGRVINERKESFQRGDFLVRNLLGADEESGAIAVGDLVRVGVTVQFHVRDAATADEDLRMMLAPHRVAQAGLPAGGLLFSCNGRGSRMFQERDHDIRVMREQLGPLPVAGFFCAGELGPIGGKNFIHGHTASVALFRPTPR